jgi:hypothetical protein
MHGSRVARLALLALALAFALITAARPAAADDGPGAVVDAAAQAYELAATRWQSGRGTVDEVYVWSVRWLDAQRELPLKGRALAAAAAAHLARMKDLGERTRAAVAEGRSPAHDVTATTYYLRQAERWVARKGKR